MKKMALMVAPAMLFLAASSCLADELVDQKKAEAALKELCHDRLNKAVNLLALAEVNAKNKSGNPNTVIAASSLAELELSFFDHLHCPAIVPEEVTQAAMKYSKDADLK